MNSTYNFNPEEKRMQLAAMLQDPTQPYKRYSGPMGAPGGSGGGMGAFNDMMMKMAMQKMGGTQPGAPVVDRSTQYNPSSQNFTPSTY
jgi:hypothetical protein